MTDSERNLTCKIVLVKRGGGRDSRSRKAAGFFSIGIFVLIRGVLSHIREIDKTISSLCNAELLRYDFCFS